MEPLKVLIVDDSATVRQVLSRELAKDPGLQVVGAAPDPFAARELMQLHHPDILTLDLEMPRLDGLSFLKRLMEHRPMPVIVVSSLTPQGSALALQALEAGALDVLGKPGIAYGVGELVPQLIARLKALGRVRVAKKTAAVGATALPGLSRTTNQVLAIGASTGGTEALRRMLAMLPADAPGTMIVQHMPPGFTAQFAQRLDEVCQIQVKEAEHGDIVSPGICLVAPGDRHLLLRRDGAVYRADLRDGPKVGLHKPAVDVLFRSVAQSAGANAIGVLLTGMGRDGADGMKLLQGAGAPTIAQDEASSVVWGMPGEAVKLGAADQVLPLDRIPQAILALAR
jgi:two-component system, chemotaxis family, protein-glutamate methylesterase/glutaminase